VRVKIERLRDEFVRALDSEWIPLDHKLIEFAAQVGITLEEPTLEERHPRPWRWHRQRLVAFDANELTFSCTHEQTEVLIAAYNREPLLLEIAATMRKWRIGNTPEELIDAWNKLGILLDKLDAQDHQSA
jgi:hypothetical protein